MAKEKEKALLKKQQREKEQQDRLAQKDKNRELQQQDLERQNSESRSLAVVSNPRDDAANSETQIAKLAMSEEEQAAAAAAAASEAAKTNAAVQARHAQAAAMDRPQRPSRQAPKEAAEDDIKKLFQLLDRSSKNAVGKRDVLVSLKKNAAVRLLFGLPVGSGNDAEQLQARINNIQDSFEASSGLGEIAPVFEELSAGGPSFSWDRFLVHCRQEALRSRVSEAVMLVPREHSIGAAFEATYEWKVVPEGAACAGGLEYKMDMATGKTLGRLPRPKAGF